MGSKNLVGQRVAFKTLLFRTSLSLEKKFSSVSWFRRLKEDYIKIRPLSKVTPYKNPVLCHCISLTVLFFGNSRVTQYDTPIFMYSSLRNM